MLLSDFICMFARLRRANSRLGHWGFDEGMLGVSVSYTVITSRSIGIDPNFPGPLTSLSGRGIIPPMDRDKFPAREYLAEHRRQWRL